MNNMHIIQGQIYNLQGADTTAGHYAAYDAGRGVVHDRRDELAVLDEGDFSLAGVQRLFMRRHMVPGHINLGWKHISTVWQVMLRDVPRSVPQNKTWYVGIEPLWVEAARVWKQRRKKKVFVLCVNR